MMQASVFIDDNDSGSFPVTLSGSISGSNIWISTTNYPNPVPQINLKAKTVLSTSLPMSIRLIGTISGIVTLNVLSLVGTTLNTTIVSNTLTSGETAFLRVVVEAS